MPASFWDVAENNYQNIVMPLSNKPEMGILIDISSFSINDISPNNDGKVPIIDNIENVLEECFESNLISDATICSKESQRVSLWSVR